MAEPELLYSMTGFGRASCEWDGGVCHVELRSVNHRYLDVKLRIPSGLSHLELGLKKHLQESLSRGRVDCTISLEKTTSTTSLPVLQPDVVAHYRKLFEELAEQIGEKGALPTMDAFLQLPGVLDTHVPEESEEDKEKAVKQATTDALAALVEMRHAEGEQLRLCLEGHLSSFLAALDAIAARIQELPGLQLTRLRERLDQLLHMVEGVTFDEQRLAQELVLLADKSDVTEEVNRIASHIKQFRLFLANGGTVGRRLDFLCQELLRETNTIGSKSADELIGEQLIVMKSEIEKLREQVQNVE